MLETTPSRSIVTSGPSPAEVAAAHGLRLVDLAAEPLEVPAFVSIPSRITDGALVLPYAVRDGRLLVAVADPTDIGTIDDVRLMAGQPVELVVAPATQIRGAFRRLSAEASRASEHERAPRAVLDAAAKDDGDGAPAVRLVNALALKAVEAGASDVHLVPTPAGLLVRARIDGVVRDLDRLSAEDAAGVMARVKVLSRLDISEQRRPQDGRLSLRTPSGRDVDVRVAILPTVDGEGAVLRLLDKSRDAPTLTSLGLTNGMQMQLERILHRGTGAFLVTGPTGSGKSTTLHAALRDVDRPEINVITIEDPVEYRLPGAYQIQVNARVGVTFDTALRSILRGDPDVLVVGEIRDAETAAMAVEAALTGHYVMTTMHTGDAPGAIARLTDMGVPPYLTSAAVSGVLAQRLVRRLCDTCREAYEPTAEELAHLGVPEQARGDAVLYSRRGCDGCDDGYRGRIGVFQLMTVTDALRPVIASAPTRDVLDAAATAEGMRSLWEDGLAKALLGLTTVDELRRALR